MAQQQQRRPISPLRILDDEQDRTLARDGVEQIGRRGVEPVTLGVRVARQRCSELTEPHRQVGHEPRQLSAGTAERGAHLDRIDDPRKMLKGPGERSVWRLHHSVTRAIEHKRAAPCRVSSELADEAALAGPGFAAQECHPAALTFTRGRRQEPAEPLQLCGPPDERKRRGQTKRGWKIGHAACLRTGTRQI